MEQDKVLLQLQDESCRNVVTDADGKYIDKVWEYCMNLLSFGVSASKVDTNNLFHELLTLQRKTILKYQKKTLLLFFIDKLITCIHS